MRCELSKQSIPGMSEPIVIAKRYNDTGIVDLVGIFELTDPTKIDWLLTFPSVQSIKAANLFDREDRLNYFLNAFYRHVQRH